MGIAGGVTSASSKAAGAFSKALATLTMDESYQTDRRKALAASKTTGQGFAGGLTQLSKGIAEGVAGIVSQPIKEGREFGFTGVLTGFGKGVIGLVTKPVSGAVDMITFSLSGMATEIQGESVNRRQRVPRYVDPLRNVVLYYSLNKSEGAFFLFKHFPGVFDSDMYIDHALISESPTPVMMFCLVKRILLVQIQADGKVRLARDEIPTEMLVSRSITETGIELRFADSGAILIRISNEVLRNRLADILRGYISTLRDSTHANVSINPYACLIIMFVPNRKRRSATSVERVHLGRK